MRLTLTVTTAVRITARAGPVAGPPAAGLLAAASRVLAVASDLVPWPCLLSEPARPAASPLAAVIELRGRVA